MKDICSFAFQSVFKLLMTQRTVYFKNTRRVRKHTELQRNTTFGAEVCPLLYVLPECQMSAGLRVRCGERETAIATDE